MASERCELLREGFLDVKFPPDSPERVLHKAWRKLWIRALVLHPLKREPSLILQVCRNHQDQQPQSLKVSRDGLCLFRCRSGSRPLQTWALSSGTSLIVYLAAANEEETQSWMQTIRDGLWPSIQNMTEKSHDVSLIDDEKTFSTGILGLYGRLVKTSDGMVSIIHPHWQGILLRWKREDVVNIQLVRKVGDETSNSGVFKIALKSSKTETRTFYFYSNTAISAIEWLRSNSIESKEPSTHKKLQNTNGQLHHHEELSKIVVENNDTSVYATVRNVSKQMHSEQEKDPDANNSQNIDKTINDKLHSSNFLSRNISSDLLDASLNFMKLPQTKEGSQNDQIQSSVNDQIQSSVNDQIQSLAKDQTKSSVNDQTKSSVNDQIKSSVNDQIKSSVNDQIKSSVNYQIKPSVISDDESEDDSSEVYEHLYEVMIPKATRSPTLYETVQNLESEYVPPLPPPLPTEKPQILRLLKLSESVAEALKVAEEQPSPVIDKNSKRLRESPLKETAPNIGGNTYSS